MDHFPKKTTGPVERRVIWLLRERDLRNVGPLFLHLCAIYPESLHLITQGRRNPRGRGICIIKEVIEFKRVQSLPFRACNPFVLCSNHFWQFFQRLKHVAG